MLISAVLKIFTWVFLHVCHCDIIVHFKRFLVERVSVEVNKTTWIYLIYFLVRISCPPTFWPSVTTVVTGLYFMMAMLNG